MKYLTLYKGRLLLLLFTVLGTASCATPARNIYPLNREYYNARKLANDLQSMATNHPELATLLILGTTANGQNPIYALKISTGQDRIPVLVIGQHHGDEVLGVEISMALAHDLVEKQTETKVKDLLARYAFWIVPTLNTDAWNIVTSGKYEWKRKNNTDTNHNGRLDLSKDGVDLNRNYPTFWALDKQTNPKSVNYKGPAPASEAEIQAMIKLARDVRFQYGFFYHSSISGNFNEKIYLPRPDKPNLEKTNRFVQLQDLAEAYAEAVPRDYSGGTYKVYKGVTSKVGNARNYFFNTWGTLAMDIEVCGINRYGIGVEHPNAEMRESIVRRNLQGLIRALQLQTHNNQPLGHSP